MGANKGITAGVQITGDAKGFKAAAEDAKRASEKLKDKIRANNKDSGGSYDALFRTISKLGPLLVTGGGIYAAFETYKRGLKATGESNDELVKKTEQLNTAFTTFARDAASLDFSQLGTHLRNAIRAAGEYADDMDVIDQRVQDLSVRKSGLQSRIDELKALKSEGKATKDQIAELKRLNDELYSTELELINAKINAKIKEKSAIDSIDAELFKNMKANIEARSKLNNDEVTALQSTADKYKEIKKSLIEKFSTRRTETTGFGMNARTVTVKDTDWSKVNQGLNDYISQLTGVQKAQLLQDVFMSDDEWTTLIGYWNQLNQVTGEYNLNIKSINRSKSAGTNTNAANIPSEGISTNGAPIATANVFNGPDSSVLATNNQLLQEHSSLLDDIAEKQKYINSIYQSAGDIFKYMGQTIGGTDGQWVSFIGDVLSAIPSLITQIVAMSTAQEAHAIAGAVAGANDMPYPYNLIAMGTSIAATIAGLATSIPKMADGGLAYGSSIVNVGEYANASNDPELISPLSKLKGLLGSTDSGKTLIAKVKGSDLLVMLSSASTQHNNNT
jgi:hypothetical protein